MRPEEVGDLSITTLCCHQIPHRRTKVGIVGNALFLFGGLLHLLESSRHRLNEAVLCHGLDKPRRKGTACRELEVKVH